MCEISSTGWTKANALRPGTAMVEQCRQSKSDARLRKPQARFPISTNPPPAQSELPRQPQGDVDTVIRTLGRVSSPAILVGHSYGGSVLVFFIFGFNWMILASLEQAAKRARWSGVFRSSSQLLAADSSGS
jgi:pimeloyl-ACP methyl ester carboxylesterase